MPIFVALGRATETGKRRTLEGLAQRHSRARERAEDAGARVIASYALFGPYDYLTLLDAPDIETVARVLIREAARGNVNYEIHPALSMDEFARLVSEEDAPGSLRLVRAADGKEPAPVRRPAAEEGTARGRGVRRVRRSGNAGESSST